MHLSELHWTTCNLIKASLKLTYLFQIRGSLRNTGKIIRFSKLVSHIFAIVPPLTVSFAFSVRITCKHVHQWRSLTLTWSKIDLIINQILFSVRLKLSLFVYPWISLCLSLCHFLKIYTACIQEYFRFLFFSLAFLHMQTVSSCFEFVIVMKKKTIYPVISQRTTRTKWAKIKRGEYFPVYSLFNLLNKSVCSLSIYWSLYTYVPHIHFISVATISDQCRVLAKTDRSFHSECISLHIGKMFKISIFIFLCVKLKWLTDWLIWNWPS